MSDDPSDKRSTRAEDARAAWGFSPTTPEEDARRAARCERFAARALAAGWSEEQILTAVKAEAACEAWGYKLRYPEFWGEDEPKPHLRLVPPPIDEPDEPQR
jgi:hypothetical protein